MSGRGSCRVGRNRISKERRLHKRSRGRRRRGAKVAAVHQNTELLALGILDIAIRLRGDRSGADRDHAECKWTQAERRRVIGVRDGDRVGVGGLQVTLIKPNANSGGRRGRNGRRRNREEDFELRVVEVIAFRGTLCGSDNNL